AIYRTNQGIPVLVQIFAHDCSTSNSSSSNTGPRQPLNSGGNTSSASAPTRSSTARNRACKDLRRHRNSGETDNSCALRSITARALASRLFWLELKGFGKAGGHPASGNAF